MYKKFLFILIFISLVFGTAFALTPEETLLYGDGSDGTIIIKTGYTVDVKALYENATVNGVQVLGKALHQGLNHGSGTYDPRNGNAIKAINFIIEPGAVLTATALGTGADMRNGVIVIRCTDSFINNGTIDLSGKGYSGAPSGNLYTSGYGPGGGLYIRSVRFGNGSPGGIAYPYSLKNTAWDYIVNNWQYLCGSGGACGRTGRYTGGEGGSGGGALLIYAYNIFNTTNGFICTDGTRGDDGSSTDCDKEMEGASGGGGGGAGGTIYIHVNSFAFLGYNKTTSLGGAGGGDAMNDDDSEENGGGGGGGANYYNGGYGGNKHSTHYSGAGGSGSIGRIHIHGNFSGSTLYPPLLELTPIIP